ncbi:hypothetical protein G4B88_029811 [Cannabis sativa]|uniref:Uncharacterized protein n=1 Tax=Cannabis sativa TaxID=3483 RepID=A0A7J6GER2_CANSA|nr:hypothetical protein G4B88_029811 [Cannabis sativa]
MSLMILFRRVIPNFMTFPRESSNMVQSNVDLKLAHELLLKLSGRRNEAREVDNVNEQPRVTRRRIKKSEGHQTCVFNTLKDATKSIKGGLKFDLTTKGLVAASSIVQEYESQKKNELHFQICEGECCKDGVNSNLYKMMRKPNIIASTIFINESKIANESGSKPTSGGFFEKDSRGISSKLHLFARVEFKHDKIKW